jgi:hypothetical protein
LDKKQNKILYKIKKIDNEQDAINTSDHFQISYSNIHLDTDAYDSILYSGYFTQLSVDAQHKFTMMYGRIKAHNDTISYLDRLEDKYIYNELDWQKKLYSAVEHYDIFLTNVEKSIIELMGEATILLLSEIK